MEKWQIDFPEVNDVDIEFGGYPEKWFKEIMDIKDSPDDRNYNEMFSELFFNGGKIPVNENLSDEYLSKGLRILCAVMGSFNPKHEHKDKVCGLILKSLCK